MSLKSTITVCLFLVLICSCKKSNDRVSEKAEDLVEKSRIIMTNRLNQETMEAAKALQEMHKEGLLPGVYNGEHGQISSDKIVMMVSNKVVDVTYPLLQTFYLVKVGETSTNNYMLERLSNGVPWQLKKAWETDSNGQVIKEWPVN